MTRLLGGVAGKGVLGRDLLFGTWTEYGLAESLTRMRGPWKGGVTAFMNLDLDREFLHWEN